MSFAALIAASTTLLVSLQEASMSGALDGAAATAIKANVGNAFGGVRGTAVRRPHF